MTDNNPNSPARKDLKHPDTLRITIFLAYLMLCS